MVTLVATILRVLVALLFLATVSLGTPYIAFPEALLAWTAALTMAFVDLWCLRRIRKASGATRALLSETMVLTAAASILSVAAILNLSTRSPTGGDAAMLAVVAYIAWRLRFVIRHLKAGTEPSPRKSAMADSKALISKTIANLEAARSPSSTTATSKSKNDVRD